MAGGSIDPAGFQDALRRRLSTIEQMGTDATTNHSQLMAARRAAQAQREAAEMAASQRSLWGSQPSGNSGGGSGSGSPARMAGIKGYKGDGRNTYENFRRAIVQRESGGRYGVMGVPVKGDRAYGAYQIMGRNIPSWSRMALGYSVTPQQFLRSPKLQDQIANYHLQRYYNKYGPAGAAVAWYAGEGNARKYVRQNGRGFNQAQYASGVRFSSISAYAAGILRAMGLA